MVNFLWFLMVYVLGFLSGAATLMVMAFWDDFKKWADDVRWKFKLRKFR